MQSRLDYTLNGENHFIPSGAQFETIKTIAGNGSVNSLRVENNLIQKYGGNVGEWKKRVGKIESGKYVFDVHWYELDGVQYDSKLKFRKEK